MMGVSKSKVVIRALIIVGVSTLRFVLCNFQMFGVLTQKTIPILGGVYHLAVCFITFITYITYYCNKQSLQSTRPVIKNYHGDCDE